MIEPDEYNRNANILYKKARQQEEAGNWTEVISLYQKLAGSYPDSYFTEKGLFNLLSISKAVTCDKEQFAYASKALLEGNYSHKKDSYLASNVYSYYCDKNDLEGADLYFNQLLKSTKRAKLKSIIENEILPAIELKVKK